MFVTLHITQNDNNQQLMQTNKKKSFAAHIKGLNMKQNICLSQKLKDQVNNFNINADFNTAASSLVRNNQKKIKNSPVNFNKNCFKSNNSDNNKKNSKLNEITQINQKQSLHVNTIISNTLSVKAAKKLGECKLSARQHHNYLKLNNQTKKLLKNPNLKNSNSFNPQANEGKFKTNNLKDSHEQKIKNNYFAMMIKQKESKHSTKDNSRQKSRANSLQESSVCCNIGKQCIAIKQNNTKGSQWQQIKLTISNAQCKSKCKKISKIKSPQITRITRIIMLDWLYQLCAQIQLPKQSLYNCIDYIDKYVSLKQVSKRDYQKISLACLFLATKLQTSSHPKIFMFLQAMDNQVERQQLIEYERQIVNALKFKLNPPTLYQYMTLVLFTIKSFKSVYKSISWINDLPDITPNDPIYRKLFWLLDGVIMEGCIIQKHQKEEICLAIVYIVLIKQKLQQSYQHKNTFQKSSQMNKDILSSTFQGERQIFFEDEIDYNRKTFTGSSQYFDQGQKTEQANLNSHQSSVGLVLSGNQINFSEISFFNTHQNSEYEQSIIKFNISYQCFMSYATTSNKNLSHIQSCAQKLKKWMFNPENQCSCSEFSLDYHQQLKQIAVRMGTPAGDKQ